GLILKEILIGMAFAFAVGAVLAAVSVAGSFLDLMVGFSFGSLVDPSSGNRDRILAQLYSMIGVLVFIAIGGDGWVVKGVARTYALVPLAKMPALGSLVSGADHAFVMIFVAALELAAPVLIAVVIADVGFGVVSRVVPQLNVFAVGFPAKILLGFLMIGVSLPYAAGWIDGQMRQTLALMATPQVVTAHGVGEIMMSAGKTIATVVGPIALVCAAVGLVSNVAQVKWKPSLKIVKPDPKRLNPLNGAKNLFGP